MIRLHHGSNVGIGVIDLSLSKKGKDFGQGFYLNPDYNQALEMAEFKVDIFGVGSPFVTSFDFDEDSARDAGLSIKVFDDYSEEWAQFVVNNRNNNSDIPIHDFDIVIGPIADDKVGFQIRRYIENEISIDKLIERIKYYGDKSTQYFFGTEKSLNYLTKVL
jgi:hypothetical protein